MPKNSCSTIMLVMTTIRLSKKSRPGHPSALLVIAASIAIAGVLPAASWAQSVALPAPRLLTTMPMGGSAGSQVDVTISGEYLDDAEQLVFSDSRLTATRKLDAAGQPLPNQYVVTIGADC